ncbi:hypothetical protein M8494_35930 [Serratia ureilytica]
MVMRLADNRWFWYRRYHHLLVDGFSFTAIARRVAIHRLPRRRAGTDAFHGVQRRGGGIPGLPGGAGLATRRRFLARKSAVAAAGHALPTAAGRTKPPPRIHRLEQRYDPRAFAELVQCGAQQATPPIWRWRWWRCGYRA